MRKSGKMPILYLCLIVLLFTGCAGGKDKTGIEQEDSILYEKGQESVQNPIEKDENIEEDNTEDEKIEEKNTTEEVAVQSSNEDEELEKSLEDFREERETMTNVSLHNGASGYGAPNLEDYKITSSVLDFLSDFDSREINEAYEAAKKYEEETLNIKLETKISVYPCVDPRITEIYNDEDKGVAKGYTSDHIFVCEYCDEGIWKYLILVRDAKGEPWSVIHHGSSYKE